MKHEANIFGRTEEKIIQNWVQTTVFYMQFCVKTIVFTSLKCLIGWHVELQAMIPLSSFGIVSKDKTVKQWQTQAV